MTKPQRMSHLLLLASLSGAPPALAQDAPPPSQTEVAAQVVKIRTSAAVVASAAAEAALKAEKAAKESSLAGTASAVGAQGASETQPNLLKLITAASTSARGAATAASAAAKAARDAAAIVVTEPARSRADRASGDAARAADSAAKAATTAEAALKTATDAPSSAEGLATAKKAAVAAASAADEASTAARAAASATNDVAEQAALPDQPVTAAADQDVLSALRVHITGGAIFFNGPAEIARSGSGASATATVQSAQFSQATTYLALESQPQLLTYRYDGERGYHRYYVEPFVNIRLTAVSVNGAANPAGPIQSPDTTFQEAQKAAQIQVGGIASMNFGGFNRGDTDFHWGIGPVMRFGFESVPDSRRGLRVWNFDDDLYHSITGGVRLMLYERPTDSGPDSRGWSPTAYLDASIGVFQRFEIPSVKIGLTNEQATAAQKCLDAPQACLVAGLPSDKYYDTKLKRRLYMEGRLILQFVYLGFDLDNGDGHDDLRFVAGLTMKLDQLPFRRR